MKKITLMISLFLLCLTSCMTKQEKEFLAARVQFVADKAQRNFESDSIMEAMNFKIRIHNIFEESDWNHQTQIHMSAWEIHWNEPYRIEKDRNLTFDSYMSYCETMNLDPKTYIDVISR